MALLFLGMAVCMLFADQLKIDFVALYDKAFRYWFGGICVLGTIHISVDESFKPVIEEELKVYHSTYPNSNIVVSYKPEVECFKDLQSDSTRMIITARGLNDNELAFYKQQLQYKPTWDVVAYDAVAVITNIHSKDSVFTIQQLQDILAGKTPITAVMDGKNATSTVRFIQDSVLKGVAFGKNVVASGSSREVIDIVSKTENAIGFVGLSWVGDNYDSTQQANLKKIRLGLVECVKCLDKGEFAKPSQATITFSQYPLARPLYYILKENSTGLGTGFVNFMSLERGQLVFKRAFLAPAKMGFLKRTSNIKSAD
ncbi:phosphate ABC transporter substrate-binding protein, PhoT family [Russula earlei]|uniref:Phosphate ABC transporter substrate-binding protein, PhoT family n=1 Tax=Russula earlei TaxID=71964 RepID=A0ACC0TT07_9AGAM|nr:phosphate ABC transporter substrate-binding protein, PhoT family [Russula earlei]